MENYDPLDDGGLTDSSDDDLSYYEPAVNLEGVAEYPPYDPALTWQENEGIPDPIPDTPTDSDNETMMLWRATKRKRPASRPLKSANKVQKRRRQKKSARAKLPSSDEMTARMMELFAEEVRAGNFDEFISDYPKPVMERVRKTMQSEYPHRPWTRSKVGYKLRQEETRYELLRMLLEIPGVKYDQLSGLPLVPDDVWTSFSTTWSDSWWLRTEPLGNRAVYEVICNRDMSFEEDDWTDDSEDMYEDLSDFEDDDLGDFEDDDLSDSEDEDLSDAKVVRPSGKPRPVPRGRESLRDSEDVLNRAIDRLVESTLEVPGARDVVAAIKDFEQGLGRNMTPGERVKVIGKFANNPHLAVAWNVVFPEIQAALAKQWTAE